MKLDFKGLITKDELENNANALDNILDNNDYAIIVDNGVGKYVVFDIDYATKHLATIDQGNQVNKNIKSPYTLVESMIKTLEEMDNKKSTAKELSFLVGKYYGKKTTPVIIRTRAEENANDVSDINLFVIEPGNIIGLAEKMNYSVYMIHKMKKTIEYRLNIAFKNKNSIELNEALRIIHNIADSTTYQTYTRNFTNKEFKNILLSYAKYKIENNYLFLYDNSL